MKNKSIFPFFLTLVTLFGIYHSWFTKPFIIGGDWPYFFNNTLREFSLFVPSWSSYHGNGLGGEVVSYPLDSYLYFIVWLFVNGLHIPWEIVHKVFFFGLYLVSSILSSIYLLTTILPTAKIWQKIVASFVFTINTYILMVVGGGQMGVALAYSVAPLVLGVFIKLINLISSLRPNFKFEISNLKFPIMAGLVLAIQAMFDPRIAYLSMIAVAIYLVLQIVKKNIVNTFLSRESLSKWGWLMFYVLVIPMGITILLHGSWILPLAVFQSGPAEKIISNQNSVGGFKFFSFASFSETLSLLHPNWPENIFGKIGFMKPEFLILPILAYVSLLFIRSNVEYKISNVQINRTILFLALLGLLGAFLAKGANPPFGQINIWMFTHIPGFAFFRDPTKFYLLIALSYSVLIPFSISSVGVFLKSKIHSRYEIFNFSYALLAKRVFLIFTISYLLFLIHPALVGQLGGTFKEHKVPHEYIELKNFLNNQGGFFRTLWIPRQQRFTFYSNVHPSVEALTLFKATSSAQVVNQLKEKDSEKYLPDLSIKYVIVPYDPFGEIFSKDRKYDPKQYNDIIEKLRAFKWLKSVSGFEQISVFEISYPKEHFWISEGKFLSKTLSPDRYALSISTTSSSDLIFSETYNPYWIMKIGNAVINAEKTKNGLNSFKLNKVGNYYAEIFFSKEKYYRYGWVISIITFILLCAFLVSKNKVYEKN